MKVKALFFTFVLLSNLIYSQNKIPLISGTTKFSVENGTIECDLILSDYSQIDNYLIRLNKGLNILNIESLAPDNFMLGYEREFTDSLQTEETISYYFPANVNGRFLPSKIRFRYVGKFPVIKDTISNDFQRLDWRGNIAFMNGILRIDGLQSAWYPTLYDIDNDHQFDEVKYDIEIQCEDCEQIYMNGSKPVKGQKAHFISNIPREPYVFMGKYEIQNSEHITLLNANFTDEQVADFDKINKKIIDFLSNYTNIAYEENVYWVQAFNTTKQVGYFGFASNPTFTICGNPPRDLKATFNEQLEGGFLFTISHELSHYYFGSIKNCNNTMESLIDEGFAEFLSLKFAESIGMNEYLESSLESSLEYVNDKDFIFKPIGEIQSLSDINDRQTYGYDYQPLILFGIEKEIGEEKMKKWVQLLLQGETPISDKKFLKETLEKAVNNDETYQEILSKYFYGNETIENLNGSFK